MIAGIISAAPTASRIDQPRIRTPMLGASAVIRAPAPKTTRPRRKARRLPMMSPILPPINISAAVVSV